MDNLHPVHQTDDGLFNTITGTKISIHNPTVDMINVNDISHGLSRICRFGGHVNQHYSVAQHSLLVALIGPPRLMRVAILHDAAEAYIGDVIKPLKNILGTAYTDIEDRFEKVIFEKFSVNIELLPDVKPYDKIALEIEHNYFFKNECYQFELIFDHVWDYKLSRENYWNAINTLF